MFGLADADAAFAGEDPHPVAGRRAYVNSKACNMLFTYEFARRLEREGLAQELTVTAFCPGLMPGSGLSRNYTSFQRFVWNYIMPIMRVLPGVNSTRASGAALARLAMDPALEGVTGKFFEGRRESRSSDESYDEEKAAELWQLSERLCA